ncbi:hypothetical protein [Promicromonospora sp. NPDC023987]|uniref:hypothetical protein n=1 Tax=Promicromonospora sp. NPDC023987 TaxID=3155360 RepID=UPI0033E4E7F3
MGLLRRNLVGRTVVIISHDMALVAEYATRVIAMREGTVLADGTPADVFSQCEVLEGTSIRPPQAAVLAAELGLPGVLTVADAVREMALQRHRSGRPSSPRLLRRPRWTTSSPVRAASS